ncbi:MAG: hypothetical protein EBX41_00700, partial [Chitinophagia bacterium]|nr:hypothetical protein [Chitinophagia bacterium]
MAQFAYTGGRVQSITTCHDVNADITTNLQIFDPATSGTITWTSISGPSHGSLSGLPGTEAATGGTIVPSAAVGYSPTSAYTGLDSFLVRASNGTDEDTVLIIVTVEANPNPGTITGASNICLGSSSSYTSSGDAGGTWEVSDAGLAFADASGTVNTTSAGALQLFYIVSNTCRTDSARFNITINTPPVATTISGASTLCSGRTTTLSVGVTGGTWGSMDGSIATVDASSGVVTGVSTGTVDIIYVRTSGACSDTAHHSITINASPTAGTLSGATNICIGGALGTTLSTTVGGGTWASSDPSIATVNPSSGYIIGSAPGSADIYYIVTSGSCSDTASHTIAVNAVPSAGTISSPTSLCTGIPVTFTTTGGTGFWLSSNPSIAAVGSSTGIVTPIAAGGPVTIMYVATSAGCNDTAFRSGISVVAAPNAGSISGAASVCVGGTITYTSSGAVGGTWSSSNSSVATVSTFGNVTGLAVDTATIQYLVSSGSCRDSATRVVSVISAPTAGTVSGTSPLCAGTSTTYTASGTAGGTWSSSNTTVATVNPSTGDVNALSAGSTTIK